MQAEPDRRNPKGGTRSTCSTVVIVEDHAMVAQALCGVLAEEGDIEVMGVTPTARQAVEMVETVGQRRPDVP